MDTRVYEVRMCIFKETENISGMEGNDIYLLLGVMTALQTGTMF